MEITQKLLPISERRSGQKLGKVMYIVAHDTGNSGSTALQNVDYYIRSADEVQESAHYFIDDKQIIQCVPDDEKAWHVRYNTNVVPNVAGSYANDHALGIELCFGGEIDTEKAYFNYCSLIASLCEKYNLNPNEDIVAHSTLDPLRRKDPLNSFIRVGKSWEEFISDVISKSTMEITKETPQTVVIDEVRVFYTKKIEGVDDQQGWATLPITDDVKEMFKQNCIGSDYNVTVE